ncbi:RNA-directed DNA polymerase, eukaryota, reverse transcriptase zinc-binding domain protein [Tanacetum coccineum]
MTYASHHSVDEHLDPNPRDDTKGSLLQKCSNIRFQYADDALFFGKWSRLNARNLIVILKCFEEASGLKVNLSKSKLYGVGVSIEEVKAVASSLCCINDSLPFIYLGLPVGKKMHLSDGWGEVINRLRNRLSAWKARSLSIGGRLILIKYVLGNNQRGISWVKWDSILLSRNMGGLGVGSLFAENLSLLSKWKWRFLSEENALLGKVIKAFYGADGGLNLHPASFGGSSVWCDIIKAISSIQSIEYGFNNSFSLKVGNGKSTSFWPDPWCDNGARFKDLFPRLYALDTCQDCKVCDRWCVNDSVWGGTWSWRFPPRGCVLDDLEALVSLIGNLSLSDDDDKCSWSRDASGSFKVKTCCNIIQDNALADCRLGLHHSWNSLIPRKVNICVWRASINKLATRANLASRGINIPSTLCPFCDLEVESAEHCLISCSRVLPIWRKVWSWWQLDPPTSFPSFSIANIAMGHVGKRGHLVLDKIINGVFQCALWAIWKWHNKVVAAWYRIFTKG